MIECYVCLIEMWVFVFVVVPIESYDLYAIRKERNWRVYIYVINRNPKLKK